MWLNTAEDLRALETCLVETDPDTTDIVAVVAHRPPAIELEAHAEQSDIVEEGTGQSFAPPPVLDDDDRKLMTAIVNRAERAGKPVKPLVLLSDDPLEAVVRTACDIEADELIVSACGAAEASTAELDRIVARWLAIFGSNVRPRTVRIIGKDLDMSRDIEGGNRVPPAPDDGGETARALTTKVVE